MKYSKQYISSINKETNFINSNIEKVIRLLDVLEFIFNRSSFKNKLILKGGTAINLAYTNLARLSVDIDLDYHGSLDKEKAEKDRENIIQELDDFMKREYYQISDKSRGSKILASKTYSYTNASGNKDNIKVEINFIDRISVYPETTISINYFGKSLNVITPIKEELFGMKIAALLDRGKPRDLYDTLYIANNINSLSIDVLRKCIVFYLSLDGQFTINEQLINQIRKINKTKIKKELLPVLSKNAKFDLNKTFELVINKLKEILILNKKELSYLANFSLGIYRPDFLLEKEIAERIKKHPMALWRTTQIKK